MKKVTVLGVGMGNPDTLTLGAWKALQGAELLIGSARLLKDMSEECPGERRPANQAAEILALLEGETAWRHACVLFSGDVGAYSGAKGLLPQLGAYDVEVLPGISAMQYFAAKLRRPWQDWRVVSAHGRAWNPTAELARGEPIFFLTGGRGGVGTVCNTLCKFGWGESKVTVGERLSYGDERIVEGRVREFCGGTFDSLSVMLVDGAKRARWPWANSGIPDDLFVRGQAPMTKREIRSVLLSQLKIARDDIVYDIGAGTGSVAVEMALLAKEVYALEQREEAWDLIERNAQRFGCGNLHLLRGRAPEALSGLPAPAAAFIGGSDGQLVDVVSALLSVNPAIRLCIACVTLETLSEASALLQREDFQDFQACQIGVDRLRHVGRYHMMDAQNPVFLLSAQGRER